jgi:hypothetical protein
MLNGASGYALENATGILCFKQNKSY